MLATALTIITMVAKEEEEETVGSVEVTKIATTMATTRVIDSISYSNFFSSLYFSDKP